MKIGILISLGTNEQDKQSEGNELSVQLFKSELIKL